MKKYKLIKTYPGSPELGAIVENYRDSFWTEVSKAISLAIVDVDKFPEYWEEVVELPKYVKCIKEWKSSTAKSIVNKIYDTDIKPDFSTFNWHELFYGVASEYSKCFVATTQKEWDEQEINKIVQECIKRFPKGSKVKCMYDDKIYTMAETNTCPRNWIDRKMIDGIYYVGRAGISVLALEASCKTGIYLYRDGKYAELAEAPKDYEILSFQYPDKSLNLPADNVFNDLLAKAEGRQPRYWSDGLDRAVIHSVKRLSDGEVFTIGDNIAGQLLSGKIDAIIIEKNGICFCLSSSKRMQLGDYIEKVKQPLFTTEDGVGIFKDDDYYTVFHDANSVDSIKPFVVYGPHKATHASGRNWAPDVKVFATKEAAENYTLYNAPRLSLNDVYNTLPPRPGEETLIDLVKSRLQVK